MGDKIILSWSGGKDSTLALEKLLAGSEFEVVGLFSIISEESQKLKLHHTPASLIQAQAYSHQLPLHILSLPETASNSVYEAAHARLFEEMKKKGVHHAAFGDLFLEEIRSYRESLAAKTNMQFIYPLWGENTGRLADHFINQGFKAVITAVDTDRMPLGALGRQFDETFLSELPESVDPCGENGEFHTFVWDGPIFSQPVKYTLGKTYEEDYRPAIEMRMGFVEIRA